MQTRGTIGNLINRYRAVLKKCSLLNTFGTLAIASAIALSGAGVASAVEQNDQAFWKGDANGIVEITGEVELTSNAGWTPVAPDVMGKGSANIEATQIEIAEGATLTVQDSRLMRYNYDMADEENYKKMTVNVNGKLTLLNDGGTVLTGIDANIINVNEGSTVDITGESGAGTPAENSNDDVKRAYLGAYKGLNINGGTINLNKSSQIFGGGANGIQFTGGTVNITAKADEDNSADIQLGGRNNTFGGDALLNVAGKGTLSFGSTSVLNVADNAAVKVAENGSLTFNGEEENEFTINQTGGAVSVAANSVLDASAVNNWNISGGFVSVAENGSFTLAKKTNISGGELEVNANSVDLSGSHILVEKDGLASFKSLTIYNNSNVIVSDFAKEGTSGLVAEGATLTGGVLAIMKDFDLSKADNLTLTRGTLAVDGTVTLAANNLLGSDIEAEIAKFTNDADFALGRADLTVTKGIEVAEAVKTITTGTGALNLGIDNGQTDVYKQNFFDTEDLANKNHGGKISQKLVAAGGDINIASGKWTIAEVTTGNGALNVTGGDNTITTVTTGNGAVTVNTGKLTVTDFTFGTGNLTVTGNDGDDQVGEMFVRGTMDFNSTGVATVDEFGMLDITKAKLSNTGTGNIVIDGGRVEAAWNETTVDNGSLDALFTTTSGYLNLSGKETYTLEDLDGINNGSNGTLISIAGTLVDDQGKEKNEITGQDELDKVHGGLEEQILVAAEDGSGLTVGRSDKQIAGFAAADLKGQSLTIDNGSALTIAGDIKNVGDDGVVVENGTLKLNNFGKAELGQGTVEGKIVEGTTGGKVETNGYYIVEGGIGGDNGSSKLDLNVQGGTLKTGEKADINVKTLTVDDNATVSSQNITVADKIQTGGTIEASKTLTASQGIDGENLHITANDVKITTGGAALDKGSSINATNMTVTGTTVLKNGSSIVAENMEVADNVTVGDSADTVGGASLTVLGKLDLDGHDLLIDPEFKDTDGKLLDSSRVAVMSFGDTASDTDVKINGNIGVGMNSLLSVGTKDTSALENALKATGHERLSEDGYTAAMYINSPQTLGSGYGIEINGNKTSTDFSGGFIADSLTLAANGLLVVNGEESQGTDVDAAITFASGNGTFSINDDATIMLTNVKAGELKLIAGLNNGGNGWTEDAEGDRYLVDNILLTAKEKDGTADDSAEINLDVTAKAASDVLVGMDASLAALVDNYNINGNNAFLAKALSATSGMSTAQVAQTIEGAAKAPMVVGVPQTAVSVSTMGADYAMARTSFAPRVAGAAAVAENGEYTNISAGDNMANGMNLWIMPMYQNNKADGFKSGSYEIAYDSDFFGVAVGADYTWANSFRLGATVNMGSGDAESTGTFAKTENDYDSVGFGVYAGYMLGNLGLSADVNYTNISNDITQASPVMALAAEGDVDVFSVGARAEYKIATNAMDIIPHIGLRYSNIRMDAMNFSGVLTTDADSANVWQMPIGVTFAKDIATESGWNVKPSLDLAVIPAFGDTDMAQTVQFAGVNGIASMNTEIMDDVSGRAQIGIEASKGNFYMGLDYAYQGSSSMDSHGVQANFGLKF